MDETNRGVRLGRDVDGWSVARRVAPLGSAGTGQRQERDVTHVRPVGPDAGHGWPVDTGHGYAAERTVPTVEAPDVDGTAARGPGESASWAPVVKARHGPRRRRRTVLRHSPQGRGS